MIIEFTGIPGSGKSFLSKKFSDRLITNHYLVKKNKYNFFLNLELLFRFTKLILQGNANLFLIKYIFFSKNSFKIKLKLAYNTIKKICLFDKYNKANGIFIFDEGVTHIPFNLLISRSNEKVDIDFLNKIVDTLPKPDLVIFLEADIKLINHRLKKRGHHRINETPDFVKKNILVSNELKRLGDRYKKFVLLVSNNKIDSQIESLINKINTSIDV